MTVVQPNSFERFLWLAREKSDKWRPHLEWSEDGETARVAGFALQVDPDTVLILRRHGDVDIDKRVLCEVRGEEREYHHVCRIAGNEHTARDAFTTLARIHYEAELDAANALLEEATAEMEVAYERYED